MPWFALRFKQVATSDDEFAIFNRFLDSIDRCLGHSCQEWSSQQVRLKVLHSLIDHAHRTSMFVWNGKVAAQEDIVPLLVHRIKLSLLILTE